VIGYCGTTRYQIITFNRFYLKLHCDTNDYGLWCDIEEKSRIRSTDFSRTIAETDVRDERLNVAVFIAKNLFPNSLGSVRGSCAETCERFRAILCSQSPVSFTVFTETQFVVRDDRRHAIPECLSVVIECVNDVIATEIAKRQFCGTVT
jgi:hypothetical protein